MKDFTKELLVRKMESVLGAKCNVTICGEDDAWYEAQDERISNLKSMISLISGKLTYISELEYREVEKMVEEEISNELHSISENTRVQLHELAVDRDNQRFMQGI